jgi:ribosomal protein S12 methylthiotransferase
MAEDKILPRPDMPRSARQLRFPKAVHRFARSRSMLSGIACWRSIWTQPAIRSTFDIGVSGEREESFDELLALLCEANSIASDALPTRPSG